MPTPRSRSLSAVASLLLVIVLAAPTAAQETTPDSTRLPESLNAARASMSGALGRLDNAGAAAHFTDDGSVDSRGQAVTGRAAIAAWFADALAGVTALRFGTATFIIADDQVTERAPYRLLTAEGEQAGNTQTIWKRQADGSWKVIRFIVS